VRILVTGAGGFVGGHLMRELTQAGHAFIAFDLGTCAGCPPGDTHVGDLRDADVLFSLVRRTHPDACIHLGGIAYVPMGWTDPDLVFSANLIGTINLLEAFRQCAPGARMVIVSSAEVYGRAPSPKPVAEDDPLLPENPYGVSKMAAEQTALLYARRYGMPVLSARPDNHIGPGQSLRFVAPSFADQVARIARKELEPVVRVGNLDSERGFLDVRDVVRAYRLLVETGRGGEAYNVAADRPVRIRAILEGLFQAAGIQPRIEVDPQRFRPTDTRPCLDISKILNDVGWRPEIPLDATLKDIYRESLQGHAIGP
jgi:GDP-4-dehydro-6-deoxy-D-mannose reductase